MWALNPMAGMRVNAKEKLERWETSRDTGKRPCADVAISQAMPGTTRSWERQGGCLRWELGRECGPVSVLISDFYFPKLERDALCYLVRGNLLEQQPWKLR